MSASSELEAQFCAHNYNPLPAVMTCGDGIYVRDEGGKTYLDNSGSD